MKNIEDLYNYAEKENITIKKYNLGGAWWKGQCLYDSEKCVIYINENLNNKRHEKCVLAHEIGHYKKGILPNHMLSTNKKDTLIRSINEFRANKWAIGKLIPFDRFKEFLGTNMSKYEVSEMLDVTEEFIELACYIYEPLLK